MADIGLAFWFTPVLAFLITFIRREQDPSYLELFVFDEPDLNETYDFIVIGAGSAGSVLANRLSEVKEWTILLLEAGGEEDVISDTPLLATYLPNTEKDWNYTTEEQKHACRSVNGICAYTRGHVLGGSSTLNYINYVRGNKFDFDNWEKQGNDGWGYDDVLPYFLKSEDMRIESLADSKYHSTGGYLTVEGVHYKSPLQKPFIEAAKELGFHMTDFNGEHQTGFGYPQINTRDGARCSAAKAFLSGIKQRPNIHIAKRTFALKIDLNKNNDKVLGVTLVRNNKTLYIEASKEVILSAGSINSPKLLMLSGIGPEDHLKEVGITPRLRLPVGANLVDHPFLFLQFEIDKNITITKRNVETIEAMTDYAINGSGPLSTIIGTELIGHWTLDRSNGPLPDIQTFWSDYVTFQSDRPLITLSVTNLRPKSVGSVKLRSSDPYEAPVIDPRFFDNPVDFDKSVKGCMLVLDFMSTKAMSGLRPEIYTLDDNCRHMKGEPYCKCAVTYFSSSMYHPTSTARMGKNGVVGPDLTVHGVPNLRVIDASIMPNITSGNTNAPTIMIAEKGADMIKRHWNAT